MEDVVGGYSDLCPPLRYGKSPTLERDEVAVTLVVALVPLRSPRTILGFVGAVYVAALQLVCRRRTWPHVFKERCK